MSTPDLAPTRSTAGPRRTDVASPDLAGSAAPTDDTLTSEGRRREVTTHLAPGTRAGDLVIQRELGRGGMGTVYEAHDERLDRPVALKILHPETDRGGQARLQREAEGLAKLSHPNVVQVYDVRRFDDRLGIVMERVQGRTLSAWQSEPRPWSASLDAYLQAGRGLAAAHAKGLVHRDFKPSNCIIDDERRVRVLDFGLVCEPDAMPSRSHVELELVSPPSEPAALPEHALSESLTRTGAALGTLAYMPLEQLEGRPASPRSDQFSFCVSLYEALYRRPPFEPSTAAERAFRLENEAARPPPDDTTVPPRLWEILARGLRRDPEARWPSMDELLAALEAVRQPPSQRSARWGLAVLGAAALSVGVWFSVEPPSTPSPPTSSECAGSEATLEGIWDEGTRALVAGAIEATDLPYARDTARRVRDALDDYADRWSRAQGRACTEVPAQGAARDAPLEPTLRCLAGLRSRLRATSTMLVAADTELARRASDLVAALPPVQRCADPSFLRAQVPVPDDPALVVEVDALRQALEQARALQSAGRYDDALVEVDAATTSARALGFEPLLAETSLVRGAVLIELGRYDEAIESLSAAYFDAGRWDIGAVEAPAAVQLVKVLGYHQAEYEQAHRWSQHALAEIEHLGDARLHTVLLAQQGGILTQEGKYDEALAKLREGLALYEATDSAPLPLGASLHYHIGVVLEIQGHYAEATAEYQLGMAQYERALGSEHPRLANSHIGLGNVLASQGRLEEALVEYRIAESLWVGNLTPQHPELAHVHNNIGIVLARLGRNEEALEEFRAGLANRVAALGPDHPDVAESHGNVGITLMNMGRLDEALIEHRRALAIESSRLEPDHPNLGFGHHNIAQVLQSQGRHEDAEAEYRQALELWTRALGPRHPRLGYVLLGLSEVQLASGRAGPALDSAERSLEIRAVPPVDPSQVAASRFQVARSLWGTGDDPRRARALAQQARDFYRDWEHTDAKLLERIEQALDEHGGR